PGGGGVRVMACSDTENGSASTATSSGIESGTGNSIDSWAGRYSAKPPGASFELPLWMPGASRPSPKFQHKLRSPASHAGHTGEMPRGAHDSHGLSTTRWPTCRRVTSVPTADTSPMTSWPSTCGNEMSAVIALSVGSPSPKSMRICLVSDPQMPVMRVRTTAQSGANGCRSSTSSRASGRPPSSSASPNTSDFTTPPSQGCHPAEELVDRRGLPLDHALHVGQVVLEGGALDGGDDPLGHRLRRLL